MTAHLLEALVRRSVLAGVLLASLTPASAGEFVVDPIRLELGTAARSGAITVRNEGKEKLSLQMQAMAWTQDADGRDVYTETQDLVFFPKLMSIEAAEQGVIRIGTRFPSVPKERTYRLFIEELPGASKLPEGRGAQMNVLIRFGAPIFVKPAKGEDRLELENIAMAKGEFSLVARNSGNQHQIVEGIRLSGTDSQGREVYALTIADRYLLAGTSKRYSATLTGEQCLQLARIAVELKTDKASRSDKLEVGKAMCQ